MNSHLHPQSDLLSWQVTNPSNFQDCLPQPYRLIDQILQQTILYQLQLNMHYIEQKKKDPNYEGRVQEYISQSLIELQSDICCVSSCPKYQNYLLAGDRRGNLLVIDVAKKSLFCKKELIPGKRVSYITQTTIYDGETFVTMSAVILNNSREIKILRSKHNQAKIYHIADVQLTSEEEDVNKFAYECHLEDDARLLVVKTFDGSILGFVLPEVRIDEERVRQQVSLNETLVNASSSVKKPTIYPLESSIMDKYHGKITEKLFEIKFQGHEKPLKYKDILNRLKNKSKPIEQIEAADISKKDPKKDAKKTEVPVTQVSKQPQRQILQNQKLTKKSTILWNNNDITEPYHNPRFSPFYYILYEQVECPRKKSFQKGKNIKMATKIIYGWTNTKEIYTVNLLTQKSPSYENTAYYHQFLQSQVLLPQQQLSLLESRYRKSFSPAISQKTTHTSFKTIYPITCTSISLPGMLHLALGLQNGSTSIYSCDSLTLEYTTQKHSTKVTVVQFFQNGWKVISGSDNGQVYISDLYEEKLEMKKSHLFQKGDVKVVDIQVNNQIGMAFVVDVQGNLRVYDLWRNEKISRVVTCNGFTMAEGKGKRWVAVGNLCSTSTIYSNRDWPNVPTSKAQQVSRELLQKVNELEKNPWKSGQINLHVIRNFEFLLDHFDGLQSVYKKGYEKAKIMNLFTNLQFTQLYDRTFDIPDFGRTAVNITGGNKNSSTTKSNLSSTSKFNSSTRGGVRKSPSNDKMGSSSSSPSKQTPSTHTRNVKLTTKVLHPEKFLFERRVVEVRNLPTSNEKLIETIREEHKKKERRANMLQDQLNKTSGGI